MNYRESAVRDDRPTSTPSALVVAPKVEGHSERALFRWLLAASAAIFVMVALSVSVAAWAGWAGAAGVVLLGYLLRTRSAAGVRLEVEAEALAVGGPDPAHVPLSSVLDVVILWSGAAVQVDRAGLDHALRGEHAATEGRLALVVRRASGAEVSLPLGTGKSSSAELTEWMRRVRLYLRGHGWIPADERDDAPASQPPESDHLSEA